MNLGNPRESTIRELAELVIKLTGSRSQLRLDPLPVDDPTQRVRHLDITLQGSNGTDQYRTGD